MKVIGLILSFFICLTIYATPTDKLPKTYDTSADTITQFEQYRSNNDSPVQHLSFYLDVLETLGVSPQKYKPSEIYSNDNPDFLFSNLQVDDYDTEFTKTLVRIYNAITDTLNLIFMPFNFVRDALSVASYILVVFFEFMV